MYAHTHTHTYTHANTHIHVHMQICISTHTSKQAHPCTKTCTRHVSHHKNIQEIRAEVECLGTNKYNQGLGQFLNKEIFDWTTENWTEVNKKASIQQARGDVVEEDEEDDADDEYDVSDFLSMLDADCDGKVSLAGLQCTPHTHIYGRRRSGIK